MARSSGRLTRGTLFMLLRRNAGTIRAMFDERDNRVLRECDEASSVLERAR